MASNTIASDIVGNIWVSTVRLSADHGAGTVPLWYETMTFACDDKGDVTNWAGLSCERYTTKEQALEGHACIVAKLQADLE